MTATAMSKISSSSFLTALQSFFKHATMNCRFGAAAERLLKKSTVAFLSCLSNFPETFIKPI